MKIDNKNDIYKYTPDEIYDYICELKEQLKTKHEGFMASIDQNCEYATILIELRSWLEEHWKQSQDIWFVKIINKLNELEGVNNDR